MDIQDASLAPGDTVHSIAPDSRSRARARRAKILAAPGIELFRVAAREIGVIGRPPALDAARARMTRPVGKSNAAARPLCWREPGFARMTSTSRFHLATRQRVIVSPVPCWMRTRAASVHRRPVRSFRVMPIALWRKSSRGQNALKPLRAPLNSPKSSPLASPGRRLHRRCRRDGHDRPTPKARRLTLLGTGAGVRIDIDHGPQRAIRPRAPGCAFTYAKVSVHLRVEVSADREAILL